MCERISLGIKTEKLSWFHLQRKLSIKGILSCLCFKSIMNSLQRDLKWHQRCHRGHLQRDAASGHVTAGRRAIASRGLFCPVLLAVRLWFQKVFGWGRKKVPALLCKSVCSTGRNFRKAWRKKSCSPRLSSPVEEFTLHHTYGSFQLLMRKMGSTR